MNAATLVVDSLADTVDSEDGVYTLREALGDAALTGDTIDLTGLSGTILLNDTLYVYKSVEILGPGANTLTVSAQSQVRVLEIYDGELGPPTVVIRDLTIADGFAESGAGITVREDCSLGLYDSVVRDCSTNDAYYYGYDGHGAGMNTAGNTTIVRCLFTNNNAGEEGTGGGIATKAVYDYETYTLVGPDVLIEDSEISMNQAGYGGGIANYAFLTIRRTLIAENSAYEIGGGMVAWNGSLLADSSTISSNRCFGQDVYGYAGGGGLVIAGDVEGGEEVIATIVHSTIADNRATERAAGVWIYNDVALFRAYGSIVSGNRIDAILPPPGGGGLNPEIADDISIYGDWLPEDGGIESLGYNIVLEENGLWPAGGTGDKIGVDPLIGLLADNGGGSRTHALLETSPAIDMGDLAYDPGTFSDTDHRGIGFPRILDGDGDETPRVDIGAYESLPACDDPPVVDLMGDVEVTINQSAPPFCFADFEDPGATAYDCEENSLDVTTVYPPGVTIIEGGVSFPAPGMYSISYSATDARGQTTSETRTVTVVDVLPPVLDVSPGAFFFDAEDAEVCGVTVEGISVSATDCAGVTISHEIDGPGETRIPITFPREFPVGTTTVHVLAEDTYGNRTYDSVEVTVYDRAAPVITLNDPELDNVTIPFGSDFEDPGATAVDACDGPVEVWTDEYGHVDTCQPGEYTLTYYAGDSVENETSITRTITVGDPVVEITVPEFPVMRDVDPALCAALVDLSGLISVSGLPEFCESLFVEVSVRLPGEEGFEVLEGLGTYPFPLGTSEVIVRVLRWDEVPVEVASASFDVEVSDPFMACLNNVAWPLAYDVPLIPLPTPLALSEGGPDTSVGFVQQFLARAGESRWYKFAGAPGSRIIVTLSDLPENFDVVVYSDIQEAYDELTGLVGSGDADEALLALLGAEFAPEAYSPEAYSPEAYSPEAYSPEAYSPEAYSPEAYSPEAYSPEAYSPEAYSPEAYSPEAYSPEAYSPEAYSPEAYSPEAYSGAQARSLIAFSAGAGTSNEVVQINTFSRSGEFYVRVRGRSGIFSTAQPYSITIQLDQEVCKNVTDFDDTPVLTPTILGAPTSLILWDSARIEGTPAQVGALATSLAAFAAASNAVVVDVSADARVNALNAQADANPACPLAKNLVGDLIRNLILGIRQAKPSIQDITLVGNDDVIPFFRTNDEALLAGEANYFPPVFDETHSNSALRFAQVLTQDRYGSECRVYLSTGPFDLPGIPVGRVVETAAEVKAYVDTYLLLFDGTIGSGGVLPIPASAFISGYDFLDDAATAVSDDFELGLGAPVDELIDPFGLSPAEGWTADQLRAAVLGTRHDLNYLAGHFSQSGALAADYTTRMTAGEVATSATDFTFAFFMSTGCHSGYQTVDGDAVPVVTEQPDWAQAFMQKFAIWIAGTAYQYGDTDFLEYSERLYLEIARALRTGSGPVSIGQAVVAAKNKYLADTALMRGIHEKALVEVALYGLPMLKLNMPGARITPPSPVSDVTAPSLVSPGPGTAFDLAAGDLIVTPSLTLLTKPLGVIGPDGTVVDTVIASWLEGSNGKVTLPAEPIRPLETRNVSNLAGLVKDVLFLSGDYTDLPGILPLTGAPATEIRGVHGIFSTEVFYPIRPWNLNHIGLFCGSGGASLLNAFPAQFKSDAPGSPTGILRRYDEMAFKVFYSPNTTLAALAAAPAINMVSSEVVAGDIVFTAEVAAAESAGIQEVWVTYTGLPGSEFYGSWQSLPLAPPTGTPTSGIGTWTGTLVGGATSELTLCYLVQAVNGVGRVTMNSNFGRYFKVGTSTLDGVGAGAEATSLEFVPPVPGDASYRDTISVSAVLTDSSGNIIVGKRVTFRIGPQVTSAFTDASGIAAVSPLLGVAPGDYQLGASFAGDASYQSTSVSVPFSVLAQGTTMNIVSPGNVADVSGIVARLVANDGTPLKEKTVIFVFDGPGGETAVSVITDGAGQARPTGVVLPPGAYEVSVYFAQPVDIPSGDTVTLSDTLYGPSQVTANVIIGPPASLEILEDKVTVVYSDKKAPGASNRNRGHGKTSIFGDIRFSDPSLDPGAILSGPNANNVFADISATLSGVSLVDGELDLRVWGLQDRQFSGLGHVGGTKVFLHINWTPPVFKSRLSDPAGPEITSINLAPHFALLSYKPVGGTYDTVISGAGAQATVEVKNGRVKKITGGIVSECRILLWGRSAIVAVPFALEAGNTVVTTGDVTSNVTVTPGVNLLGANGRFQLVIDTPKGNGPLYNDTPAILELDLTLGVGAGETPFGGNISIGDAAKPWTKENTNLRMRQASW